MSTRSIILSKRARVLSRSPARRPRIPRPMSSPAAARPEIKVFDVISAGVAITSAGNISDRSAVAGGVLYNNRDGAQLYATRFDLRLLILGNAAALDNALRVIVLIWNDSDTGAAPAIGNILQDTVTQPWVAPYLWPERARYRVLYDRTYGSTYTSASSTVPVYASIPLRQHMITFGNGVNTGSHHIYVLLVSDEAVNGPAVAMTTRLFFYD